MTTQDPQFDPEVRELIARHLDAIDYALARAGAQESQRRAIVDDVRAQIMDELAAHPATAESVAELLAGMDPPESYAAGFDPPPGSSVPAPATRDPENRIGTFAFIMLLLFGVVAPAGVLLFEATTHFCGSEIFDPIPTLWHKLLVAMVPLANLLVLVALLARRPRAPRALLFLNGFAIAISLFYVLVFLPLMPFALVATLAMGVGLLPLSPLFAFVSTVSLRSRLKRSMGASRMRFPAHALWGVGAGFLALFLIHGQAYLTDTAITWASSSDAKLRERGLTVLRTVGSTDELLHNCYGISGRRRGLTQFAWFQNSRSTPQPREAREAYYRLTGQTFNSVPPPQSQSPSDGDRFDWTELDPENRDGSVGFQDSQLLLGGSRLDGIVDPNAGVGYVEWTLTFDNKSPRAREARAQIALPPGGVVSRLTLWVNGQEREAAFAQRAVVKKAYEDVVTRTPRRDPVLVTTSGNDRILLQCFPVPADGTLKTRVGIAFPLGLVSRDKVELTLPAFLDRNFSIADDVRHNVWVEIAGVTDTTDKGPLRVERVDDTATRLTGQIKNSDLASHPVYLIHRSDEPRVRTFADLIQSTTSIVRQEVKDETISRPSRLVIVVDDSPAMKPYMDSIAAALSALPKGAKSAVIVASSAAKEVVPQLEDVNDASLQQSAQMLKDLSYQGGQDNVPALEAALGLLGSGKDGTLLWIHGPQPVVMRPLDALLQRAERGRSSPAVYELQVTPGRDSLLPDWSRVCDISSVPRRGTPGDDLKAFLATLDGGHHRLVWSREKRDRTADDAATSATRVGGHVSRLWASDQVSRASVKASAGKEDQAVKLACEYQLVTPVTGAVVLENQAMYDAAKLKPVDATTVPTIPEPEEWALIIVASVAALWTLLRRRQEMTRA